MQQRGVSLCSSSTRKSPPYSPGGTKDHHPFHRQTTVCPNMWAGNHHQRSARYSVRSLFALIKSCHYGQSPCMRIRTVVPDIWPPEGLKHLQQRDARLPFPSNLETPSPAFPFGARLPEAPGSFCLGVSRAFVNIDCPNGEFFNRSV